MPKLRFLKFYSSSFNGENKCKISYLQDPGFAEVKLNNFGIIIHAACNKLIAKTPNPTLMPRLNKLAILNLRGSKSHKSLPSGIFNLEFLTKLDLSGCPKLKRLPEISSGIVEDVQRIPHMDHKLAVRWQEIQENTVM
ncbi:hypothetical protein CUMW_252260 [Citrus unshiu]|uniref:Uncharacterized protein n=1 Tax=Citrus unshiu TaxID=55188 RepID=A0A2H5QQG5_CITUN|nr:hypothetical protein CUMW_252260 [Citrus unshiu]